MFSKTKKDDSGAASESPGASVAPSGPSVAAAAAPSMAPSSAPAAARPAPSTGADLSGTPRPTISPVAGAAHAAPQAAPSVSAPGAAPKPAPTLTPTIQAAPAASTPAPRTATSTPIRTSSNGDPILSNPAPRPAAHQPKGSQTLQEAGKLIVGREIKLKGEITSCERLVVEGSLEAALMDSRTLDVTPGGHFKGMAVVDSATISGHFEGELTVEGLLTVTSTGRIIGTIRFGELEVERGGTLSGDIAIAGSPARSSGSKAPSQDN